MMDQRRLLNDQSSQHVFQVSFDGNDLVSLSTYEKVISMGGYPVQLLDGHDDRYQSMRQPLLVTCVFRFER